jgi:hypothetical protein
LAVSLDFIPVISRQAVQLYYMALSSNCAYQGLTACHLTGSKPCRRVDGSPSWTIRDDPKAMFASDRYRVSDLNAMDILRLPIPMARRNFIE